MQMKKLSLLKMVHLSIHVFLTFISVCLLLNKDIKQFIFSSLAATILFAVIWIILVANFVFLLMDFRVISNLKLNYHNLYEIAFSDPLSGIPNRFSCDVIIEKYIDKTLPEEVGCIVLDLTNLPEVNAAYSHATGNKLLTQFAAILTSASASHGFIGRNGGNKFLAIFENSTQEKFDEFLHEIEIKVEKHNQQPNVLPIEYKVGTALNSVDKVSQITKLIGLANRRVYQ